MRRVALIAALLLGSTRAAGADPLDEFGMGAHAAGLAGSYLADARGADAAHHNPAGVALGDGPDLLIGYGFGDMRLRIDGRDAEVLNAHGTSIGLALPVRLGPAVVAAGLALYLPDQFIARIQIVPASEPHFVLLDNDPHRIVVEPVVAVDLGGKLALGAGASVLTDVSGRGITFDVGVVSGEKVGEAALDVKLPVRVAPLFGLLWRPLPRLRAGVTYRGALGLDLALDVLANVDVAGVVTGDTLVAVRAGNYYTPRRVSAGVAIDALPDLTLSGELTWTEWSGFSTALADVRVLVNLDITPPLVQTAYPAEPFLNTVSGRAGAEWHLGGERTRWALRAGYAYTPSPVPPQLGLTSFADNDRHLLALGAGVTLADWRPLLTRPVSFDVAAQWHHLQRRLTVKDPTQYPGDAFSSSGDVLYVSTSATVSF